MNQVLKLLRTVNNLASQDVAKRLGVDPSFVSKIESGDKKPSKELLEKYSEIFRVKVSTLEFFDEERAEKNGDFQKLFYEILEGYVEKKKRKQKKRAKASK